MDDELDELAAAARQSRRAIAKPKRKRPRASPILILGRVIFGGLAILSLGVAIQGRFGEVENERRIYVGLEMFMPSMVIFLLTFVRRAF
jgi:hypothetical protein